MAAATSNTTAASHGQRRLCWVEGAGEPEGGEGVGVSLAVIESSANQGKADDFPPFGLIRHAEM
jgi:hypothetical protein